MGLSFTAGLFLVSEARAFGSFPRRALGCWLLMSVLALVWLAGCMLAVVGPTGASWDFSVTQGNLEP